MLMLMLILVLMMLMLMTLTPSGRCSTEALSGCGTWHEEINAIITNKSLQVSPFNHHHHLTCPVGRVSSLLLYGVFAAP